MRFTELSWAALAATLMLGGCASSDTPPAAVAATPAPATVANDGRCHAEAAQFAVGQGASPALLEQARQRSGSQVARALGPNDAITMDYRSDRLSLYLDTTGKVSRASCG